jgi:hypothetical protein
MACAERAADFQIWCGPAMGAFNTWVHGSFLDPIPRQRGVVQVARNLLEGAAVVTRAQQLRSYGVPVPAAAFDFRPRPCWAEHVRGSHEHPLAIRCSNPSLSSASVPCFPDRATRADSGATS